MKLYNTVYKQVFIFPDKRAESPTRLEIDNLSRHLEWESKSGLVLLRGEIYSLYDGENWTKTTDMSDDISQFFEIRFNSIPVISPVCDCEKSGTAERFERRYVIDVYDRVARSFDKTRTKEWSRVEAFIRGIPEGSTLADIGCGNGRFMCLRGDIRAIGCDASQSMVSLCRERGLDVVLGDILDIPFPDAGSDYVICIAVVHHLADSDRRKAAVRELVRILKPGGMLTGA